MDGPIVETFATKGIEYLLVLGFLAALLIFLRLLRTTRAAPRHAPDPSDAGGWFAVPEGYHFHQGHTWTLPQEGDLMLAGMDDFSQRLVGEADGLELPAPGTRLRQGHRAWRVLVDGHVVDVLSPVSGEVVAVNEQARARPSLVNDAPYGAGWLVQVRAPGWRTERTHLLSGELARAWMRETTDLLRRFMNPDLGLALQDGGVPVKGIARHLDPAGWHDLADRFLANESSTVCTCRPPVDAEPES